MNRVLKKSARLVREFLKINNKINPVKQEIPPTPTIIGDAVINFTQIEKNIEEFYALYQSMPEINNVFGMKSPHLFLMWYALKQLAPQYIIESGVYKGLGTWWIEQACPNAHIFCIDIDFSNIEYKSSSNKVTYLNQDFSKYTWENINKNKTVIFFDDHQNALTRMMQMKWMNFPKAIFEDNYPSYAGDCYSCKKILAKTGHQWKKNEVSQNSTDSLFFKNNLKTYQEFPSPFRFDKNRFGYEWTELSLLKTPVSPAQELLFNEANSYTYMCLVELKSAF
jgi:hypothetical protein